MIQESRKAGHYRALFTSGLLLMTVVIIIAFVAYFQTARAASSSARTTRAEGDIEITLVPFTTVPFNPVDLASSGINDDFRLFVVQQNGVIQIALPDGTLDASPFLDIQDRVNGGGEMGLLGLVFDPDYESNGFFYVNYTHMEGFSRFSRISRFEATGDPNVANPSSELILITVSQPQ